MLLRGRISRSVSLLILGTLLLRLESSVASSRHSAHLNGLSDLILKLVFVIVVIIDGFLHLAPCADNVLLVVVVHLIVNFFSVVVEGIINVLLFDFILVLVDALQSKCLIRLT